MKKLSETLQKLEENGSFSKLGEKVMKVALALILFLVLLILAQVGMFFGIFHWLEGVVRVSTGLDAMLAKAIAFLLLAVMFGTPLGGFVWSFLPIPQKKKKQKRFIFLAVIAVFFFGAYFSSRNVYFDPETGEALKYYSVDANGEYRFFSSEGYDPVTGEELRPVDGRIISDLYSGRSVLVQSGEAASETEVYYLPGNDPSESPLGNYERRYLVKFRNEQERGIFLCYTEGHGVASGTTVILIPPKGHLSLRLSEGSHQIAFVDSELNEYGHRGGGSILREAVPGERMRLTVEGREKVFDKHFTLEVLRQKKQEVVLEDNDLITHSQEQSKEQNGARNNSIMILLGIVFLIGGFFAPSSNSSVDSDTKLLLIVLGGFCVIMALAGAFWSWS